MDFFGKKCMSAILKINSNARAMVHGDNLNDCVITWLEGTTPISKAEIEAEISNAVKEIEDTKTKRIADKASADAKLKVLGLTDDEIEAFRS